MLEMKNKSDAALIVLHEIYGINRHMETVCERFFRQGYDVFCPDLTNAGKPFDYSQEEEAYRHFMKNVGFESAAKKAKQVITKVREQYRYLFVLGFSIGATTAWLLSGDCNVCDGLAGYYGSRIRDFPHIVPKCPALLIFPEEEKSFSVEELAGSLIRPNVEVRVLCGKHGFSDPFNNNFNEKSCANAANLTDAFFERIKGKNMRLLTHEEGEIQNDSKGKFEGKG
ncbi:MAG: dienelactone hydrolase family protein [Bacillota bacterium]